MDPQPPEPAIPPTATMQTAEHPRWMYHLTNRTAVIWMAVITIVLTAEAGFLYYQNLQLEKQINILQSPPVIISPAPTSEPMTTVRPSLTPTCRPRPACLDATPRCLIPETSDMCPAPTKTPSTLYTCPSNGWVDCMPGPRAGVKYECTPEAFSWYQTNCPDFKGGAM